MFGPLRRTSYHATPRPCDFVYNLSKFETSLVGRKHKPLDKDETSLMFNTFGIFDRVQLIDLEVVLTGFTIAPAKQVLLSDMVRSLVDSKGAGFGNLGKNPLKGKVHSRSKR